MGDSNDSNSTTSYINSSKYRINVLKHLAEAGKATPTDIAESVDNPRPHVSRALSELQERGVVELLVPEGRTVGRYYGLTEKGEEAWPELEDQLRTVEWSIEEPTDPTMRSVLELIRGEFDDRLRVVGVYDGEEIKLVHADPDVLSRYSDEEFEEGLRTIVLDHSLGEFDVPRHDCWSEVLHFDDFTVLSIVVSEGLRLFVSFDNDHDVLVPEFAESVVSEFETAE
ncbi:helix-turn-helix domain-containing protein [Halobaculum sp. CBA1158]|uniref:winged helix-turn-helix domain-containing protein n=1 Tax=Halobaculum sp. CBA1158 TaxID=2904243 RepID=UPI001F224661|nr:winged helix-turn-helix domain-containing protein [Halobaculum sp. CBA1158]UIO99562.1 helix-turn-helix domain-containing protein [Halobaculum sp. CBA1158]